MMRRHRRPVNLRRSMRQRSGRLVVGVVGLATVTACVDDTQAATGPELVADAPSTVPTVDEPDSAVVADDLLMVTVQHGQCQSDASWCEFERGQDQASVGLGVMHRRLTPRGPAERSIDELIQMAIDLAPDGIAISVDDEWPLRAETKESLNRSGIPIVTFGGDIDRPPEGLSVEATIGQSDYGAGYETGRLAAASGASGAACINDQPNVRRFDLRCQGFYDALGAAGIPMKALAIPTDRAEADDLVGRFLDRNPGIDAYLSTGPVSARATADSIIASPRAASIGHGTIDADLSPDGDLASGRLRFGFDDQPFLQGFQSIRVLTHLARYDLLPSDRSVSTRTGPLTGDDIAERGLAGREAELEIGVLLPSSCRGDLTWCPFENGARAAGEALGVQLTFQFFDRAKGSDVNVVLEKLIDRGFDGIAVAAWDPETLRPSLVAADERGTPVVVLATGTADIDSSVPMLTAIGHDDFLLGFAVGQRLIREGGSSRGLCVISTIGYLPPEKQCAGFNEALSQANVSPAMVLLGADADQAAHSVERQLIEHPETDFVFSTSPEGAAAVDGYLQKTDSDLVLHATVGLSPASAESLSDGRMTFAADLQPYDIGFESVSLLAMTLQGNRMPPGAIVAVEPRFVDMADIRRVEPLVGSVR